MTGGSFLYPIGAAIVGVVSAGATEVFAAGTEIAPWAQVGGTATAVGALAYVAKLLADGRIVAFPIAEMLRAGEKREERLIEALEDGRQREDALRALLMRKGME